jgi:hypothetical protein
LEEKADFAQVFGVASGGGFRYKSKARKIGPPASDFWQ